MHEVFGNSRRSQALLLALVAGGAGVIGYQAAPGQGSSGAAKLTGAVVESHAPWVQRNAAGHAGDFSGVLAGKQMSVRLGHPGPVGP